MSFSDHSSLTGGYEFQQTIRGIQPASRFYIGWNRKGCPICVLTVEQKTIYLFVLSFILKILILIKIVNLYIYVHGIRTEFI